MILSFKYKVFCMVTVGDHFTSFTISFEVPKMFMITTFWFSRRKSRHRALLALCFVYFRWFIPEIYSAQRLEIEHDVTEFRDEQTEKENKTICIAKNSQ